MFYIESVHKVAKYFLVKRPQVQSDYRLIGI